ncbi:hypothetical protein [Flavobacterium coralii]|uniref:hypothetical protein n=1 Tax=Flavobacterium coralii TaxID=2838017 RepID=UPI002681D724|tara:strand:- start:422 stop:991 length:570 start_codon:yes stop_codon:yes gene_type:complete
MQPQLKYVELKSGYSDNGPAWIGYVQLSKSGKTVYFDGKALQSLKGSGTAGNYFDIETGDEYWISGVKKDLTDRHWAGGGKVLVDKEALQDYLNQISRDTLPKSYELTKLTNEIPKQKIYELENTQYELQEVDISSRFKNPSDLSIDKITELIPILLEEEKASIYNKARRSIKQQRIALENELQKRLSK